MLGVSQAALTGRRQQGLRISGGRPVKVGGGLFDWVSIDSSMPYAGFVEAAGQAVNGRS